MSLYYEQRIHSATAEWLVFFHGIGGDCSIFGKQIPFFQEHFNLLLIDLPGHGRSAGLEGREPVEYTARRILELLELLRLPPAHFLGVSLGTVVMQHLASQWPERIKSLVLAGAVYRFQPWGALLARLSLRFPLKQLIPARWSYLLFAHILLPRRNHQKSRALFIQAARVLRESDYHAWGDALVQASVRTYARLEPGRNTLPKLYVCGSQDHMFLPSLRRFVEKEALAELTVLPACGHVCNIERAEHFNALALSFLRRSPKAPACLTVVREIPAEVPALAPAR
jgi:pimeloyl-ACP methyl ester carboxylesterase